MPHPPPARLSRDTQHTRTSRAGWSRKRNAGAWCGRVTKMSSQGFDWEGRRDGGRRPGGCPVQRDSRMNHLLRETVQAVCGRLTSLALSGSIRTAGCRCKRHGHRQPAWIRQETVMGADLIPSCSCSCLCWSLSPRPCNTCSGSPGSARLGPGGARCGACARSGRGTPSPRAGARLGRGVGG